VAIFLKLIQRDDRVAEWFGRWILNCPSSWSAATLLGLKETHMANGTVKWFNPTKGFGFIQPENGGADVFVHISALEKAGLRELAEGQKVSYELATERGKTSAANLKLAA
jgi:CspA family cold shock protein